MKDPTVMMSQPHPFAFLVHLGRSGSTVVGDLLGQHTRLEWAGEIWTQAHQAGTTKIQTATDFLELPNIVSRVSRKERFGFELKFINLRYFEESIGKADWDRFIEVILALASEQHKPMLLIRRNALRRLVSCRLAAETGVWHRRVGDQIDAREGTRSVVLPVDEFEDWDTGHHGQLIDVIGKCVEWNNLLEEAFRRRAWLTLSYEEHVSASPRLAYRRIIENLGMSVEDASSPLQVTAANRPLHEVVSNWSEVSRHLKSSPHSWMLEQD